MLILGKVGRRSAYTYYFNTAISVFYIMYSFVRDDVPSLLSLSFAHLNISDELLSEHAHILLIQNNTCRQEAFAVVVLHTPVERTITLHVLFPLAASELARPGGTT